MELEQSQENTAFSILKLRHMVFDELSFTRKGFKSENDEVGLEINVSSHKDAEGLDLVTLLCTCTKKGEYVAKVQLTGYFEISDDCDFKDKLLRKNAVAILFPYVRSEFALLTAQPETSPLMLPVFNIDKLVDQADKMQEKIQ